MAAEQKYNFHFHFKDKESRKKTDKPQLHCTLPSLILNLPPQHAAF